MSHSLERVIREADGFLLIGDSSEDRFPAYSYHAYTTVAKRFYCLDLGGLSQSRGPTKGGKVYDSVDTLPPDRGDLAIIWVKPGTSKRAVDIAHQAGCKRVWFSFHTAHREAVARAEELGMEVVEVGRCPVYYLDDKPAACKAHSWIVKLSGTYDRAPQAKVDRKLRVMM